MTLHEDLWRTWLEAHLWIERPEGAQQEPGPTVWWHIAPRPDGVVDKFPPAKPVYLLTAWNPLGEELPREVNEARQKRLLTFLNGERIVAARSIGASEDRSWVEPGFALFHVTEGAALDIGRRFEQAAIYAWGEARLEVVGALREGRASIGWSLDVAAPPSPV